MINDQTVEYKIMKIAPAEHPMNILNESLTIPLAITPKNPHEPWIENASSGSSIWRYFNDLEDIKYRTPLRIPITTDAYPEDTSQLAVIPTRPANKPLPSLVTLCILSNRILNTNVVNPPNEAAILVLFEACLINSLIFTKSPGWYS